MLTALISILLHWETFIALDVTFYHELYNRNEEGWLKQLYEVKL
jgi:hypothetical protein